MERTLCIVKPDAVAAGSLGKILARLEEEGFRPVALRLLRLDAARAEAFYAEHAGKPFFAGLVTFMTSGPCLPVLLERADAVAALRAVIGATDPAKAAAGTIRRLYGTGTPANAVHASDSAASAAREAAFFFPEENA